MDRIHRLLTWPAAFYIAGILLWYEQYKLTGNPGSVWLFTVLSDWLHIHGYEKPFRLFVASMEIAASLLVLVPYSRMWGAALALGVMSGAIFFHSSARWASIRTTTAARCSKKPAPCGCAPAFILLSYRAEAMAIVAGALRRMNLARP